MRVGLTLAVVCGLLFTAVTVIGPERVSTFTSELFTGGPPSPEEQVVALADSAQLTQEGRDLLFRQRPRTASLDEIAEMCGTGEDPDLVTSRCWSSNGFILISDAVDPFAPGTAVTVLAHELLHAAYDQLDSWEIGTVDELVAAEYAKIPADDPIQQQIDGSVRGDPASLPTELFAYLGTQVMPPGGFAPELEAVYARWFSDRAALVAIYIG